VFTNTFLFPDVNVWFALAHEIHPHHNAVIKWGNSLDRDTIACFCRFTQLGLLRLLTNRSAMGLDVLTQAQAWVAFDALLANPANRMMDEPRGIDPLFRQHTDRDEASTKQWADGYLAAFADAAGIRLVTLDRALAGKVKGAVLLG
jgi:toxin-antitoxin system PIN domain toxin